MSERGAVGLSDAAKERYHGHLGATSYVAHSIWLGLIGLFTIPAGFELFAAPWSWVAAAMGALLIAGAIGIWFAREWARITSGVLTLTLAGAFQWAMTLDTGCSPPFDPLFVMSVLLGLLATGLGMLSPMAARRFRRAREFRAMPHGRWH